MIPEGVATLLAFLGLIAPGLVHQLVLEKRRPQQRQSSFREASRVALTSLVFTGTSLIIFALIEHLWRRGSWLIDLPAFVKGSKDYYAGHVLLVSSTLAAVVTLSSLLAAGAAWLITKQGSSSLVPYGAWYQVLRKDRPTGYRVWMHVSLLDGSEFWGHLRHYTEDDTAPVREIVLGGEMLAWRREPAGTIETIGDKWDAVSVGSGSIRYIRVAYQDSSGQLFGRTTAEHVEGRRLRPVPEESRQQ